jgi:hypothetical protein
MQTRRGRGDRSDGWSGPGGCAPIVTTFFTEGCTSPVGFCTEGTIPSGPLAGTTRFSVLSLTPVESAELLLYLYGGTLVITTPDGSTLTMQDRGVLNRLDGTFFEMENTVGGTGVFEDHTGTLFGHGTSTPAGPEGTPPAGFEGTLTGWICGS